MFKKFVGLCLTFCMAFGLVGVTAQAKDVPITTNTVITQANLPIVLNYLNINSSNFIKSKNSNGLTTVGELEKAIKQAKTQPSVIYTSDSNTNKHSLTTDIAIRPLATNGTKMLYKQVNCDAFTVEYEVAGKYSGKKWVGANSASVSVDSDSLVTTYKIGSKSLNLTYTSSAITLKAKVVVDTYIGVGNVGLIKIHSLTVNTTATWDTSYI